MEDILDKSTISDYLIEYWKRRGDDLKELGRRMHNRVNFACITALTRTEYGLLRHKLIEMFLPNVESTTNFPAISEFNIIDQIITMTYLFAKKGLTEIGVLSFCMDCSVSHARNLVRVGVNALYHVFEDCLNKSLNPQEIIDLEALFNSSDGTTALILTADWSPLCLKIGAVLKRMLIVADASLRVRFAELAEDGLSDERGMKKSTFYKVHLKSPIIQDVVFRCTNPACDHAELLVTIPFFVFADGKMDPRDFLYWGNKHIWTPMAKESTNGQGRLPDEEHTFNIVFEGIRFRIENGPIREIKQFKFLRQVLNAGQFSDAFITRVFELIVKMVNGRRNGFFQAGADVDVPPRRNPRFMLGQISSNPRGDTFECAWPRHTEKVIEERVAHERAGVKKRRTDAYEGKFVNPYLQFGRMEGSTSALPKFLPPAHLRGRQ